MKTILLIILFALSFTLTLADFSLSKLGLDWIGIIFTTINYCANYYSAQVGGSISSSMKNEFYERVFNLFVMTVGLYGCELLPQFLATEIISSEVIQTSIRVLFYDYLPDGSIIYYLEMMNDFSKGVKPFIFPYL